jgi:hypothetical protein
MAVWKMLTLAEWLARTGPDFTAAPVEQKTLSDTMSPN